MRSGDAQVGDWFAENLGERFGREVDDEEPWHVRYWHGGWDGDLMRGLMKGRLRVPLRPV